MDCNPLVYEFSIADSVSVFLLNLPEEQPNNHDKIAVSCQMKDSMKCLSSRSKILSNEVFTDEKNLQTMKKCESLNFTRDIKILEKTRCSTDGGSIKNIHQRGYESREKKLLFKMENESILSLELKTDMLVAIKYDIVKANTLKEAIYGSSYSNSEESSSSCSDVEYFLEDNTSCSSQSSLSLDVTNEVTSWQYRQKVKGNLSIDEPSVSDSSSCDFSFEYLKEEVPTNRRKKMISNETKMAVGNYSFSHTI